MSEELGEVHASLLVLLLNFAKHQTKVKVVKAQNGHQDNQHQSHHPIKVCHIEVCNIQQLTVNIQEPNMRSLKMASQTTLPMKTTKCFMSKASFLLVFLKRFIVLIIITKFLKHIQIPDVKTRESKAKETQQNGDILPVYQLCQ